MMTLTWNAGYWETAKTKAATAKNFFNEYEPNKAEALGFNPTLGFNSCFFCIISVP